MKPSIFKEYDIRGVVGQEFFIEKTYDLTKAILSFVTTKHPGISTIIIGNDGRVHSPTIKREMIAACIDNGFNVIDIGLCPTPVVYFAAHLFNLPVAIAITASHNPSEYNGLKITGVWGKQIKAIEKNFYNPTPLVTSRKKGTVTAHDCITDYIGYMSKHFSHLKGLSVNAVIDCANGAAGSVIPDLVKAMEWHNVKILFEDVDGTFPNHEADPTIKKNMTHMRDILSTVQSYSLGIGFDGDADRMCPMTKEGNLVPGDKLLALFAEGVIAHYPGAAVVCDIKSSQALIETLTSLGAQPCVAPSGHSLIKQAIVYHNALLAGELSCHFFFKDRYFGYDDGIYAAMRLVELLCTTKKDLATLVKALPSKVSSPEFRIKCSSDTVKNQVVKHVKAFFAARKDINLVTIDGVRVQMGYGWGLARASNTQPVISLRFESSTTHGLELVKRDFMAALDPFFDAMVLKDTFEQS